jgi:acyl dehydratase
MSTILATPGLADDAFAEAGRMLGEEFRIEQWNEEASKDVIRHYAWGIGDDNPLYTDAAYAAKTRWGRIVAPPTFLYSVFDAVVAPGLPDVQWIYSGADWTFHKQVYVGDAIKARARLVDVKDVGGKRVKRMLVQTGEVTYANERGETVASVLSHTFRIPRSQAEGGLQYETRSQHRYSADDLAEIERAVLNEYRRGAEPRYWEDVREGEVLPTVVKGPINRLDMTCYYAGAVGTSGYKSTKLKWKYAHWARHAPEKLPNNYDPSYYAAAVSPSIGHQDEKIAQDEIGMPGPYDNGPQRIGFMTTCVTNWMGDDGFVRALSARIKLPVIFGDTTYCKGKVVKKRIEDGKPLFELKIWAENQLGQTTASGGAVVELPRRHG